MTPPVAPPPTHLLIGPTRHGVVRFGVELSAELARLGVDVRTLRAPVANRPPNVPAGGGVHVQFTDRLFGADADDAAGVLAAIIGAVHDGGGLVSVTLHDLPQESDGAHAAVRSRAYRRVADAADAVVVSSDHERRLLADCGAIADPAVIPLPLAAPPAGARPAPLHDVGVLGFVYPGKGHADVLAALPAGASMVVIGAASDGHRDLLDGLAATARADGRRLTVTGHVPQRALLAALRSVAVPVVAHRHVSASGSMNSWLSAGRRPLAPANRYVREIARRNPGAVATFAYDEAGLAAAIRGALADPASTWLPSDTVLVPSPRAAAVQYADLFAAVHR